LKKLNETIEVEMAANREVAWCRQHGDRRL